MESTQVPSLPGLRLRLEQPEDQGFQEELYGTTRAEELEAAGWPGDIRAGFVSQQFRAQSVYYRRVFEGADWWIVEYEGRSVGRFIVHRTADHLRLVDLSLLPDHRGRGMSTALLRWLLEDARIRSLPVRLSAFLGSRIAGHYRRLGFHESQNDGVRAFMEWRPA